MKREPGLYRGLTYEQYAEIEGIRSGDINRFDRTPLHARYAMAHPRDSKAMVLGRAAHVALLEPDAWTERYILAPKVDRRTKKGKADWAAFEKEVASTGRIALESTEWDYCLGMRDALYRSEVATKLLRGKGINEGVLVWDEPDLGVRCKARFDRLIQHGWDPWHPEDGDKPTFIDLKTSRDARKDRFAKDIWNFGYHISAAHYLAGGEVLTGITRRWVWVVVENEPPHDVAIYDFDDTGLELAEEIRRRRLTLMKECQENDDWPGSPDTIQPINLPHWAFKQEGE